MKGTIGFVVVIGGILCLTLSCVSTPQANQTDASRASTATEPTAIKTNTQSEASPGAAPEVSSPVLQSGSEVAQPLVEPPQLFPEASPIPIQPAITKKVAEITLPTPTASDLPPNTASTATDPARPQGAETASTKPEVKSPASSSSQTAPQTATAQKNAPTGSASASAEKKAPPVDPQSLKAPEPKTESSPVQGTVAMPTGGIPELPSKTNPALAEEKVVLSRSVQATVGQLVEIPYQGAGWVYLGEVAGKKGLAYDSRRLDPDGQTFIFRCESAGTYTVKFFKQDFIKDYIINDYVEVVVGESPMPSSSVTGAFSLPVDRGRVVANPRWPTPVSIAAASPAAPVTAAAPGQASTTASASTTAPANPSAASTGTASPTASAGTVTSAAAPVAAAPASAAPASSASGVSNTQTSPFPAAAVQSSPATPPLESLTQPEEFINQAKKEVAAGQYASALSTLQAFTAKYPAGSDEVWWLYGQILEAKGPQRDIKGALTYYKRLTSEYPQSQRYDEAQQRIAYLERFYFDIR
uniref:Outer membrane lipoprotein BamD-like domain-containing protein n=1 Tax=Gracilinema caldarium TaxID=215591 RepID=A0A7C3IKT6_9SPIR